MVAKYFRNNDGSPDFEQMKFKRVDKENKLDSEPKEYLPSEETVDDLNVFKERAQQLKFKAEKMQQTCSRSIDAFQ
jgi:hypothetical protein